MTDIMAMAILLLLAFFLCLLLFFKRHKKQQKLPPGPTNLPIIGSLHRLGHLPHRSLFALSQKHGPLMYLKLGIFPTVVASSADVAKEFLKTHDIDCCSRPHLTSHDRLSYGSSDVAFAPYADQWRELRKVCILELLCPKKVLLFRPIREEEVGRMVDSISSRPAGKEVNLGEELILLANNITCMTATGKRYHAGKEGTRVKRILVEAQALFMGFFIADYVPALGWLDVFTGMRARLERTFAEFDEYYQGVIDEHVDRGRSAERGTEDAIDALLNIKKKGAHVTNEHIKGVLMDIFVAGTDTSSATAEWAMAELMRNPSAMRKAQDEVRSVLGSKGKAEESDLDSLPYLNCVMKETMRLHPIVPLLVQRVTSRHFTVGGYDIPPGTRLLINTLAISRDTNVWERPTEFLPERFIDSPIDIRGQNFELIPFGAGRRICPGISVGIRVVGLALANLLYSFDWELPLGTTKEDIDMSDAPGITVHRKYPLRLVPKKYNVMEG